ncbi:MAG TPA: rRNA maturation RNase YbeY [Thermoleophilia bacterium]|nr:rRNA maturation RNase YbeY [Thermoleophilia bacterium]
MFLVDVVNETDLPIDEAAAVRAVLFVFESEGLSPGEVALAFIDEDAMAELNERYRGGDGATDVLSFPGDDDSDWPDPEADDDESRPPSLGDVIVCPSVARRNAAEDGITTAEELRRLVVHGVLHLLGYDHELDDGEMKAREAAILDDPAWGASALLPSE